MKNKSVLNAKYDSSENVINLTINVCGLCNKLLCTQFTELINSGDIKCFQETKTDDLFDIINREL